jgi:hypothetical protein
MAKIAVCMGSPSVQYDISGSPKSPPVGYWIELRLDLIQLNQALHIIWSHQEKVMVLFLKSYGGSYGEFSEHGFPHNFA